MSTYALRQIDTAARAIDPSQVETVRRLLDEITALVPAGLTAVSAKDRLVRAQLTFYDSGSPTVSLVELNAAIGTVASEHGAPSWIFSTLQELTSIVAALRKHVPHLLSSDGTATALNPFQLTLVGIVLVLGRLRDPGYPPSNGVRSDTVRVSASRRRPWLEGHKAARTGFAGIAEEIITGPTSDDIERIANRLMNLLNIPS